MSEAHTQRRTSFRLIDALIALGICGLIAALIAVPMIRVRDDAKRAASQGRLAQLALATSNYCVTHEGKYPAIIDTGNGTDSRGGLKSFFFELLPFMEAEEVYRLYDAANPATYFAQSSTVFTVTASATTFKGGAANQWLRMFVSPADDSMRDGNRDVVVGRLVAGQQAADAKRIGFNEFQFENLPVREPAQPGYYAPTSYAVNAIAIRPNQTHLPGSFPDGAATTILLAERPQLCGRTPNLWGYGSYGSQTPTFGLLAPPDHFLYPSTGQAAPVLPLPLNWSGAGVPIRVGRIDSPIQAADFERPFQVIGALGKCDPRLPGTPHASGLLIAMADGSVRVLNPNISSWTFWAACTPDGNETLGGDW